MSNKLSSLIIAKPDTFIDIRTLPNSIEQIELIEQDLINKGLVVDCEVNNYINGNVYIRELVVPKGLLVFGRIHKYDHISIMLSGEMYLWTSLTGAQQVKAPYISITNAGSKRVGYALQETRFLTVHSICNVPACIFDEDETIKQFFTSKTMKEYLQYTGSRYVLEDKTTPIQDMW